MLSLYDCVIVGFLLWRVLWYQGNYLSPLLVATRSGVIALPVLRGMTAASSSEEK